MPVCRKKCIPTVFSSSLSKITKEDSDKQSTKSSLRRRAQIPHFARIIWYLEMGGPKRRPEVYFLEVKCSWMLFLQKEICNWNQNSSWEPICFREFNLKGEIYHNLGSDSGQDRKIIFPCPWCLPGIQIIQLRISFYNILSANSKSSLRKNLNERSLLFILSSSPEGFSQSALPSCAPSPCSIQDHELPSTLPPDKRKVISSFLPCQQPNWKVLLSFHFLPVQKGSL